MKTLLVLLSSALLLAGCGGDALVRDDAAGAYVGLTGAEVQLIVPVKVAAGKARVFIQGGDVPRNRNPYIGGGFNQYRPHCAFEIRNVDHDGVIIEPDTFRIVRTQESLQEVVQAPGRQFAGLGLMIGSGVWGGGASYHLGYHFTLYSERQPDVMRMSCYGVYAERYDLYAPTVGEIRAALRGVAEIHR